MLKKCCFWTIIETPFILIVLKINFNRVSFPFSLSSEKGSPPPALPKMVALSAAIALLMLVLLCVLIAMPATEGAPSYWDTKYTKKSRFLTKAGGGSSRRSREPRIFGNLINVDPWAFPNQFPYPSIPIRG